MDRSLPRNKDGRRDTSVSAKKAQLLASCVRRARNRALIPYTLAMERSACSMAIAEDPILETK